MKPKQYSVVFAGEAHAALLRAALPRPCVCVTSRAEFIAKTAKPGAVAFVDFDLLDHIDGEANTVGLVSFASFESTLRTTNIPIVGIIDDTETLPRTVQSLDAYPWLSHMVASTMLSSPLARSHLEMLLERLAYGPEQAMLGTAGIGRVALLTHASRREARFERMREFFSRQGLSDRMLSKLGDVSEELVMNALYDAPVEAGYFKKAVPRTQDVDLPPDRACEISYGIENGTVFVRLRDTFGALSRERLLDVLTRCNTKTVKLDESRGGAGLGLWRVFSAASTIAITVIPGRLTDILIGIAMKDQRDTGRVVASSPSGSRIAKHQLLAVHLFFVSKTNGSLDALIPHKDQDLIDQSITLVRMA